jgi:hypothetical protein
MAKDLFEAIPIPAAEKDYVLVGCDSLGGGRGQLLADHATPFGANGETGRLDGLDDYAVFRYLDALAAYTFAADSAAKQVALGHGSPEQVFMGLWPDGRPVRPAMVFATPPLINPMRYYYFHWLHPWNPRQDQRRW